MYYKDENNSYEKGIIHLKRRNLKDGKIYSGMIEYKGSAQDFKTKYLSEDSEIDIFNYVRDENACGLMNNNFHSIEEWNDATFQIDFPLYPDLISRHFKNPRSADVIISTMGSYNYKTNHGKKKQGTLYCHDIGLRESSVVPLIIGGSPEIPQKELSYCKVTDIVPTLIYMLGKKPHQSVIGKNLVYKIN